MAKLEITPEAVARLDALIRSHSLPYNTRNRVAASLFSLTAFPRIGSALPGRWEGFRFILGPWRWMILVYVYDEPSDTVSVVTIQDSRSAESASAG